MHVKIMPVAIVLEYLCPDHNSTSTVIHCRWAHVMTHLTHEAWTTDRK